MGLLDVLGGGGSVPDYKAYDTVSGVGSTMVDGDRITTQLDPRFAAISEALTGGLAGGISPSLSPEQLAFGREATGAGAGFLRNLGSFDPFEAAQTQFGRMEEILAPGRERARESLEGRLLRQGRLGSTGGGRTQEGLETAIERSRQQSLYDAFGQAQGVQAQQGQLAQMLGGLGLGVEQGQFQRQMGGLQGALGLEQSPLAFAEFGSSLSGQRSQHQQAQAMADAQNMQALMGFAGGIGSGFLSSGAGFSFPSFGGGSMNTGSTAGFDPYSLAY